MTASTKIDWAPFGTSGKIHVDRAINLSKRVYHYIKLDYAAMALEKKRIRLTPCATWPDRWEAPPPNTNTTLHNFGSCWTSNSFSEVFWRAVSYGGDHPFVRLKCKLESLLQACDRADLTDGMLYCAPVRYRPQKQIQQIQTSSHPTNSEHAEVHARFFKRNAFAYEKEIRLIFACQIAHQFIEIPFSNMIEKILLTPLLLTPRYAPVENTYFNISQQRRALKTQLREYGVPIKSSRIYPRPASKKVICDPNHASLPTSAARMTPQST